MNSTTPSQVNDTPWGRPSTGAPPWTTKVQSREELQQAIRLLHGGIVVGGGQSYSDAAAAASRIRLSRTGLVKFLPNHEIYVAAGFPLADLLPRLASAGYTLPVIPGTAAATLGGCLAADVHGKNHLTAGNFSQHVRRLTLMTSLGTWRDLSSDTPEWRATVGGFGLTGIMTHLQICLAPIETAWMIRRHQRYDTLQETLRGIEVGAQTGSAVCWLRPGRRGIHEGTGLVTTTRWMSRAEWAASRSGAPLTWPTSTPRWIPAGDGGLLTRFYLCGGWRWESRKHMDQIIPANEGLFPLAQNYWRLFGSQGLRQYQVWLPQYVGTTGVQALLRTLARAEQPMMISIRATGATAGGYLSFIPGPGWSIAVDVPNRPDTLEQFQRWDPLTTELGGRVNLAKSNHSSYQTLCTMYPDLPRWQQIQQQLDPARRWRSHLGSQTGLVESINQLTHVCEGQG